MFALLARTNMEFDDDIRHRLFGSDHDMQEYAKNLEQKHITPQELFGLKV